jgi:hypothetical protein
MCYLSIILRHKLVKTWYVYHFKKIRNFKAMLQLWKYKLIIFSNKKWNKNYKNKYKMLIKMGVEFAILCLN